MKAIVAAYVALLASCGLAQSGPSTTEQRPRVEANKQANGDTESKQIAGAPPSPSGKAASSVLVPIATFRECPAKPKTEHGGEDGSEFWGTFHGIRIKITDSLLVFSTLLLWVATRRLVKGADDTAKRQLRSYVSAALRNDTDVQGKPVLDKLRVEIENTGQTPAYGMTSWARCDVLEFPLCRELEGRPPDDREVSTVLHHKETRNLILDFPNQKVAVDISNFKNGHSALYVWGEVHYKDTFKSPHTTKFIFFMNNAGLANRRFGHYETGNDAT